MQRSVGFDIATSSAAKRDVPTSEMEESVPSLLSIPAGVENVLLSFISCGDGGLQRILNMRKVCSTTKSWVDNLPKRQADVVFSRAQVAMACDEQSMSRFLTSPPPFGVTSLSLQVDALREPKEASSDEEEVSTDEEEASSDEEEVSSDEEEASSDEEKVPLDEEKEPSNEEKVPLDEEKEPSNEEKVPLDEEKVLSDKKEPSLNEQEASLEGKIASLDGKVASLEGKIASLDVKVATLEGKLDSLEGKVASLEGKVTSLEGKIASLEGRVASLRKEEPRVDETTWSSFCAFWNLKLETLTLKVSTRSGVLPFSRRLVQLMESPNLLRLKLCDPFELLEHQSLPTSFFQNVRELRTEVIYFGDSSSSRDQLFAQLENNSNLTVLSVCPASEEDFLGFTKVIDRKKDDMLLQLSFDLESTSLIDIAIDPEIHEHQRSRDVLAKFGASIVASRSQIRLKLFEMGDFEKLMTELLPAAACRLFTKIESINSWTPTEESLSLMESLPQLKKLETINTDDSSVDFDRLVFPPLLEELGFASGFPARQRLPESLTSLCLDNYVSDVDSLVSSLNILSRRCPALTSLLIDWKCAEGKSPTLENFETAPPQFPQLRKLSFGYLTVMTGNVGECRTVLVNGFDWRILKLNFLELSCANLQGSYGVVVGADILRSLCEGPSAKTLLTIQVANELVTPEGLPHLETLRSLASANWTEREEQEGRGGQWRKLYGPVR